MPETQKSERIAKVIARSGLCSRRDAERWIEDGRVEVDGQVITTAATLVGEKTKIRVDGKPLPRVEKIRLWCYYKPSGLMTTHYDPEGRPTVFENLPEDLPRVISVGRLDQLSEGLLLLTNDGEYARKLEHPSSKLLRTYRVQAYGELNDDQLKLIRQGITIDGFEYRPIDIRELSVKNQRSWFQMTLQEGKNREIRKIMEYFQLRVLKLIREEYGPFSLDNLYPGEMYEVADPMRYFS
jgi:23S rRNA pseudouridine2605 synthase